MKMLFQGVFTLLIIKIPGLQGINADPQPGFQVLKVHTADSKRLVADNLRRRKLRDLVHELGSRIHLGHQVISGADVGYGNPVAVRHADNAHDIIVFRLIQRQGADIRAGSHHPDYLPAHDSLGGFRVLHLLADGHLKALGHQLVQIGIRRVIGNPAHGSPLLKAAVLSGQSDLQGLGGFQGIVKKHLIKITQPVK